MKKLSLLVAGLLCVLWMTAQEPTRGKFTVSVVNEQDQPLENVTVQLLRSKDSVLVKASISDKSGQAEFDNIRFGSYILKASMVNHAPAYSSVFSLSAEQPGVQLPKLALHKASAEMKEVVVSAKKPFIQKMTDRIIVNVDNSIVNAGSSAFDVLERSPGVQIDPNDNISLRGRSGVIIMIDGKITPMTGADLVNMLRGLPSNSIESIHIITNPSAKYDAAGNSGIIDIRMKKDQRLGTNGTLTAGYGQGVYPKANAGIQLNHRNKKVNVFGNYNYAYRVGLNHLMLDRNFYTNGVFNGADLKDNYSVSPFKSNAIRFGADFFPGKKTIIGFVVNANLNRFTRRNDNSSIVINNQRQPESTFKTNARNNDRFDNGVANINFKHTFDSTGKELTADVDYGVYNNNSLSTTATEYYKLDGSPLLPDYILNGDQDGKLTLKTAKADYVNPLKKGAKFEVGVKTSFVSADNDAKFFDVSHGTPVNDVNKTNHFLYDESNNAGYVNFSKQFKKFDFQVGLRGEHTSVKTHQRNGDIHWDSSYFQLFPSAYFNYHLKKDQTLGISVSRRIDRPGYSQLNPFLFLIDVTTYATGAPGLLPQLTWSYEMSYTLKNLNFTLGYSHTKNTQNTVIARFKDVLPHIPSEENVTVQIPVNLKSSDYVGLSVAAPVRVNNWWNMINNADIYYNHYNGNLAGTALSNGQAAVSVRSTNNFSLKKGWSAELSANYNSGGRSGYMVFDPQWGLAVGVQKSVMKNKGTVRFNVTDIFWTNLPKAVITYNNYIEKWHAFRETRVATLSFSYRFGNSKVAAARRRTTASEEERRRAGGN
ncbi:MAG TPA: outer membrane beta-barrel protein [Chitinophagaceae bacterium]|nr:outer membrane beta-barrel protein [Chitinophagaceae bacterium]